MFVPRPYTEAGKNTFHYGRAVFWNSLSNKLEVIDLTFAI